MSKMKLSTITKEAERIPPRILLYGPESFGKSTFGLHMPKPIFIPAESGLRALKNVHAFPKPEVYQDVLDAVEELRNEKHEYRTLIIDTIDSVEELLQAAVCKLGKVQELESYGGGFGKGYKVVAEKWRGLLLALENLNVEKRMTIVLLSHSQVKVFNDPTGPAYDRYILDLNDKLAGATKKWCDVILFGTFYTAQDKDGKHALGGQRIIHTEHSLAFDAKNRYSLPPVIEVDEQDHSVTPRAIFRMIVEGSKNEEKKDV